MEAPSLKQQHRHYPNQLPTPGAIIFMNQEIQKYDSNCIHSHQLQLKSNCNQFDTYVTIASTRASLVGY
jgi:hypothetical protein